MFELVGGVITGLLAASVIVALQLRSNVITTRRHDMDPYRPYPWWTRIWPLGRIYFAGWVRGEEAGIERGWFQATGSGNR